MKEVTLAFYDIFRKTISYMQLFESNLRRVGKAIIGLQQKTWYIFETDFNNLPVLEGAIFMENDFPQNIGFQIRENCLKLA